MLLPQLAIQSRKRQVLDYFSAAAKGVNTILLVQPWLSIADISKNMPNIPSIYDNGIYEDLEGPWGHFKTLGLTNDSYRYGPYPRVDVMDGAHEDGGEGLTIEFWYNFFSPTKQFAPDIFSSWNTDDPTQQMPTYSPWYNHIGYGSWRAASTNIGIATHDVTDPIEGTNAIIAGNAVVQNQTDTWYHYAAQYGPDPTTPTTYRQAAFNNGNRIINHAEVNAEATYDFTNHVDLATPIYFALGYSFTQGDNVRCGELRISRGFRYDIDSTTYDVPTGPFVLD